MAGRARAGQIALRSETCLFLRGVIARLCLHFRSINVADIFQFRTPRLFSSSRLLLELPRGKLAHRPLLKLAHWPFLI